MWLLSAVALTYVRGWMRSNGNFERLTVFLTGLLVLFIALESPLDRFGGMFLWVHMTQHILLMTAAPLLVMLGRPQIMLLRGLPREVVKDVVGPFLAWPAFQRCIARLTSPAITWFLFASSMIFWHLPKFYELALRSSAWHDVQHAFFFWSGVLFWSPLLSPHPGLPRWFGIPYLLLADILNTAFSAFLMFSGQLIYPVYATVRLSSMSAAEDQVLAGAVMWVPGSILFLVPAIVIAFRLLGGTSARTVPMRHVRRRTPFHVPSLFPLRRLGRPAMLVAAIIVIADGFHGTQTGSMNVAGTLPWIHWRALSIAALLLAGNLFCMTCPLTLARDLGRRLFPPRLKWPRWLRAKWIAVCLMLVYLWAYDAFELWDRPQTTALIIIGYFGSILIVDCIFAGASFCKYICPIGQFNFVVSTISPAGIGVRDHAVCVSCRTYDCIRGNAQSRGCELSLFQPVKSGNLDCTFCLDCVNACPSANVALLPVSRLQGVTEDLRRWDAIAFAAVMVFGAFVNAGGMLSAVMPYTTPSRFALFVIAGSVIFPISTISVCFLANSLFLPREKVRGLVRRCVLALTPLGVSMWISHLLFHVTPAQMSATTLHQAQILILDGGVLITRYAVWKIAGEYEQRTPRVYGLTAPWFAVSLLLYALGIWILFQPMRMTGMSM